MCYIGSWYRNAMLSRWDFLPSSTVLTAHSISIEADKMQQNYGEREPQL